MADIWDRKSFETWLEARPEATQRQEALALASRAAASVLPFVSVSSSPARPFLASLRAAALAQACAKYPTRVGELRPAADAVGFAADTAILATFSPTADPTTFADANIAAVFAWAAAAAATFVDGATFAADADAAAAADAAATFGNDAASVYARLCIDATVLETDARVTRLLQARLWPVRHAKTAEFESSSHQHWANLASRLLTHDGVHWQVWIDWYDAVLVGKTWLPDLSERQREELTIQICLLPEEDWKEPEVVNTKIADLIAAAREEARKGRLPDEGEMPQQTPGAPQFGPGPDGRIDLVPPGPRDGLTDTPQIRDLYEESRIKALALAQFGAQILGDTFDAEIRRFLSKLPVEFEAAYERGVWSVGNSARCTLNGHDAVVNDPDAINHPTKLDKGAAEKLRDLVQTFNQLAFADPKLRGRDTRRPGPEEVDQAKEEIKRAGPLVQAAAQDQRITTPAAAEEILQQRQLAKAAGEDLPGKLQTEQARDADRNFIAGLLSSARNIIAKREATANHFGREITSGALREVGKQVLTAGEDAGRHLLGFIRDHSPQLADYCAHAFEHARGAAQIIDLIKHFF